MSERSNKYDVIRENKSKEVFKEDIVVGDIFVVKGGLEIPVDGLVVEARDVILDESSMTGESHEVYKNTIDKCLNHGTVGKDSPSPVIISGSKIVSGEGKMVVLVVGKENRMGKLSEMIQEEEEDDRTPL